MSHSASFKCSLRNISAKDLVTNVSKKNNKPFPCNPYLSFNFDNDTYCCTEVAKKTTNPTWTFTKLFYYSTQYENRMDKKHMIVEYWNKYKSKKALIGTLTVDLLTIATGPVRNIYDLVDNTTKVVGTVQFDIYFEQLKNVGLDLKLSILTENKLDLDDFILEAVPMLKSDKKRTSSHTVFKTNYLKKESKGFFNIKSIPFVDATFKGLLLGLLDITLKTKKKKLMNNPINN